MKTKLHPRGGDPRRVYPFGPEGHNGYQAVMYEARFNHDPYDQWGWCLMWLGAVAEVLTFDFGTPVPRDIFTPGSGQREPDPDSFEVEMVRECVTKGSTDDDLRRALHTLDRFADWLQAAGHSY